MLVSLGMFLFNVMCGLVPCDPKFDSPEISAEPLRSGDYLRNVALREVGDPVVQLPKLGAVEGHIMTANEGRDFLAFEGVPYGKAERWRNPVPMKPWQGTLKAKKPGPDCLQINIAKMFRVYGSEDCLTVNVFSPSISEPRRFPVIIFVHGGSFILGSGQEYGPSYIMNEDVVMVTLNYRLGVLGFFSTGDEAMPGNYGLKDQALALKWVYENIEYFGGDPQKVTLMGNSAGGVSVHLHLVANRTREYFTSGFSSSGTGFEFWGVQNGERMKYLTYRLARQFGCQSEDSFRVVKCLEKLDSNALVAAQLNMFDWFPFPPVLFSPTVEPEHPDAFLTIWPDEAYKKGLVAKKPYILGATKDEGYAVLLIMLPMVRTFPLRVMWDQIIQYYFQYQTLDEQKKKELASKINNYFFTSRGVTPRNASLETFGEMVTDRYLTFGTIKGVQAHQESAKAPTYLYYFSFKDGAHNMANVIGSKPGEWGASHGEDMFFFFNNSNVYNGHKLTEPDHELSSIMVKLLVSFAATGEPTYISETGEVFKIWEPIQDPSNLKALQLDKRVEMIDYPKKDVERLIFLESLGLPNVTLWTPLKIPISDPSSIKVQHKSNFIR